MLVLMIGWTGVPLDPRILADGYYDGEGNWIVDYSYTDTSIDTDGDGLSDYDESYIYWTDTLLTDTDGDGISDYDEVHTYFTSPTVFDGAPTDSDGDGLPDTDEIDFYGTDPWSTDTDGDGMSDYDEITIYYTNPTVSDSPWSNSPSQDSDGDGLTDSDESSYGTDPWSADSDGDGYSDYEEIYHHFTNPTDASSYTVHPGLPLTAPPPTAILATALLATAIATVMVYRTTKRSANSSPIPPWRIPMAMVIRTGPKCSRVRIHSMRLLRPHPSLRRVRVIREPGKAGRTLQTEQIHPHHHRSPPLRHRPRRFPPYPCPRPSGSASTASIPTTPRSSALTSTAMA